VDVGPDRGHAGTPGQSAMRSERRPVGSSTGGENAPARAPSRGGGDVAPILRSWGGGNSSKGPATRGGAGGNDRAWVVALLADSDDVGWTAVRVKVSGE
jgi:hypothetical protein